jgi:hypothetical protein
MLRLYLKLLPSIALVLLMLNVASGTVGSIQPPNPVLAGFTTGCEGKLQPCWYGIVPYMPLEAAQNKLEQIGYSLQPDTQPHFFNTPGYYYLPTTPAMNCEVELYSYEMQDGEDRTYGVHLIHCENIFLGDFMAALGKPDGHTFLTLNDGHIWLGFQEGQIFARNTRHIAVNEYRAENAIEELWLFLGNGNIGSRYAWHGFIWFWKYCEFEPSYPICPHRS